MRPNKKATKFSVRASGCSLVLVLILTQAALAHKPSDSYLRVQGGGEYLTLEWDLALKDLEYLVGLDSNQDAKITWGELKAQQALIAAKTLSHLQIRQADRLCQVHVSEMLATTHSDGGYAVLRLMTNCPGTADEVDLRYRLLFDVDPTHRGLVLFKNGPITSTHVLSPTADTVRLPMETPGFLNALCDYMLVGIWHIWIGFDHILFLLALLLPSVFVRRDNHWQPVPDFRPTLHTVLKVVTVFTVAHSLTLWLSVMRYVTLPSQMVEATIAFSIIATALHNLWPVVPIASWAIAFVFGLIHGFGFANVLLDLGLSHLTLAAALLGFNLGVELGQLAIVLVFLPIAFHLRGGPIYRWGVFVGGSLLVIGVATVWLYERTCDVEILGF